MEVLLTREVLLNKTLCRLMGVAAFAVFMSLGAFVRIPLPFSPVPLTLQTFFVLLSGACLGGNLGAFSQLTYILVGILGLPVFAGAGSGLLYLLGPTAGYMLGFVLASLFIGRLINYSHKGIFSVFALFCLADLILLSCGTLWLKGILGYPFAKSVLIGFLPFVPGDLLKASVASVIYSRVHKRCKEIF
jgi:biotin transport system substrate-specific component